MKKIILAIAVVLMATAIGIAAAAEGVDVSGDVINTAPGVSGLQITSGMVAADGTIPIDAEAGVTFTVDGVVTDINGVDTLTVVNYQLFYPDGTLLSSGAMTVVPDVTDVTGTTAFVDAVLSVPAGSPAGSYSVEVTAFDEDLSGTASVASSFTTDSKFSITPLLLENLVAGNTVTAEFGVTMNYGQVGETFTIDSAVLDDLIVTKERLMNDTIPASAINCIRPLGSYPIGEQAIVQVTIEVPYGTHGGSLSGTGNIVLTTHSASA